MNSKITTAISIVALVVSVIVGFIAVKGTGSVLNPRLGAAGNMLAEQYLPVIQYNGGYKSALPVVTTGGLTVSGGLTNTQTDTATSTLSAGCIQVTATSTASPIVFAFSNSFTSTTTFPTGTIPGVAGGGLVVWRFGTCPL